VLFAVAELFVRDTDGTDESGYWRRDDATSMGSDYLFVGC